MRRTPLIPAARKAWLGVLLAILLLASLPAQGGHNPTAIRVTDVEVTPLLPSYLDRVTVTVSGRSTCLVTAEEPVNTASGLLLPVTRGCILDPPLEVPFIVTFELPPRSPGEYELVVADRLEDGPDPLFEGAYQVYRPGLFVLETPGGPPTDDAPFTLRITGYGPFCPEVTDTRVEDGVIEVRLNLDCAIGTPPLVLFTLDHEIGPLAAGDYRVGVVEGTVGVPPRASRGRLTVYRGDGCIPSATELCLNDDRFRLAVTWRDFEGGEGEGVAVPVAGRDDTGMFWFFNQDNVELTVKVLDGCGVNGHYWVFVSPGSTVDWELTVTDTLHDESRTYGNALGDVPSLIPDTAAFATCP